MAIDDARAISGALLSAVMALFPDAAVTADSEGLIVSVNERAEELFGYEPGSLAGVSIETLVPERVRLRHRDHRASYLTHPQTRAMGVGLELTGRRRNGSEFPLDISLAPIMNEGQQLVVAAIRDVTEQRQATVAQAELATIVSSSLDAIIATSVDGHITNWNPAAEALLGYTREEMLGEHISTLVPEQASIVLEELLDNGTSGEQPGAQDTCWRHRDGEEVEVSVSMSPLRDKSGSLCGYSAFARVSGRKATERELLRLLEEETRLQHAHATSSEIRRTLLSSSSLHESLVLICGWASALLDAPVATVSVLEAGDLHIEAAVGAASGMMGMTLPTGQSLAEAAGNESAKLARRGESSTDPASGPFPEGPRLDVPIVVDGEQMASLDFVREIGSEGYSPSARRLAETLAEQASLAFEQERLRQDNNETALVDDRERIGRDLHDHVVQRLFAADWDCRVRSRKSTIPRSRRRYPRRSICLTRPSTIFAPRSSASLLQPMQARDCAHRSLKCRKTRRSRWIPPVPDF